MTLTLVTVPSSSQQYPSGLIAMRAKDFLGAARGTLTTAADPDSLAGTVAVETQALSLATSVVSFTTRWNAASDTLSVPWATLTSQFPANSNGAYFFVSMKIEGDTATGGDAASSTHLHWAGNGLGPGMAWGNDTSLLTSGVSIWRSVWGGQYMMTFPTFISLSSMSGTNMTMRLWGITGGTLSYSIDAFYVVPRITDMGTVLFPSNFFVMSFGSNGTMFTDLDTDETDVPFGGHHSVTQMRNNVMEAILFQTDIQEANDEISYYDLNGNGLWGGATDPPGADPQTWVTMMAAPVYLPQQSLLSDSFANSNINPGANIVVSTPTRFTKTLTQGNFSPPVAGEGVSEDSGNLRAILTANQTAPTPVTSSFIPHCTVFFGQLAVITGETSTPDHQHPLLLSLEDCTQTFSFDVDTVSEYRIFCGQTDNFGGALSEYVSNAAILEFDGAGNMDLSLVTSEASFVPTLGGDGTDARVTIDGPVNITSSLSTGTTYWLKVDRQRYFWRAKCWEDGSSEPDWQVSGFQYLVWRASGGGSPPRGTVAEPYNSNWVGDTDHDIVLRNPVDSRGVPFITFEAGFAQPQTTIRVFDYDLDLEPEGSSPVDMSIEEEKYDGTTWDSIVVPYSTKPSWRMVEGSLRNRNFNLDTNGFNLRVWKDAGGPVLQESAIAWVFQRARANAAVIPLFRPRVFSVSDV